MTDYVQLIYNERDRPKTSYPQELCNFLCKKFNIPKSSNILDVGCGRGDFTNAFSKNVDNIYGIDISDYCLEHYKTFKFKKCDLINEKLPFENNTFDIVFSKSVMEHLYYPENLVVEIRRILKPGGRIITMCPAWEHYYRDYFDDYTHRTPFMKSSLSDLHILANFTNVKVEFFKQLPFVWKNYFYYYLSELVRLTTPRYFKKFSKTIKFSHETMLLATGIKDG